ncbi:MAG: cation diffusion facilitator family transporter [Gammaproteobacteria bacterium]|nr:cation diffusion facilitator family transporter [Gammaproteobacteria bacterium]
MDDKSLRDRKIQRVILIEGSANLIVLIAKLFVGLSTSSLAILADAIHSLTDVANNIVAWIVIHLSSMPADREHPYGHRKFETLAVFGLAALLTALAFELAINAINKKPTEIITGDWELGIMIGVLCINISLANWQRIWARRLKSDILLADASHTFADVMTTIVVILGWQLSAMGYPLLDKLCALGVAGLIIYLAFHLFKRAIPILVDEFAIDPELLSQSVKEISGVHDIIRIRSRWMGNVRAVDMIITVDSTLSTEDAHLITENIESALEKRFNVLDTSIHVEPDKK